MPKLPSVCPNSPPQLGFTPRKEFIREQRPPPNSFAVLAIASSSFIRLYSFPLQVVTSLRHLLEQHRILTAFRENVSQSLYEFTLEGKPWANAKSVATEKLIIDLVAVVYQCGYTYLSTLDYGREHDDRLVMAFSKPDTLHAPSRSGTPSQSSEKSRSKRIPFALSFTSGTTMRVIAPPLILTPAILQAVRNAWPRGVVSEKKVGENSFEFKLKGYKWFQQDTFPTDSLSHILSLLSSLDTQSYTLLSSISLTNHSRVKDLWIFMGPPLPEDSTDQNSPASSILDSSQGEVGRQVHSPDLLARSQSPVSPNHRKFATEPDTSRLSPQHARAVNAEPRQRNDSRVLTTPPLSGTLRKVPPRPPPKGAQVSPSPDPKAEKSYKGGVRAALPSTISSDVENMTGVGAGAARSSPNVFYTPSSYSGADAASKAIFSDRPLSPLTPPRSKSATPSHHSYLLRPVSTRSRTPPLLLSNSSSPSSSPPRSVPNAPPEQQGVVADSVTPPLLGAGTFRDSAFSSSSQATFYIPIKAQDEYAERDQEGAERPRPSLDSRASSAGLTLPGGWHPSPVKEEVEIDLDLDGDDPDAEGGEKTPIYEVGSRVSSPELTRPDSKLRKSETAVVGVISEPVPSPPPMLRRSQDKRKDAGTGQGWVLVNVDGMSPSSPVENTRDTRGASRSPAPLSPASAKQNGLNQVDAPRSPEARTVVVFDEKSSGKKSSGSPPQKKSLFGLGRNNSRGRKAQSLPANGLAMNEEKDAGATKYRPGLRDKLRLRGTPEASRNDSK